MAKTFFSVVIPAYNAEEVIEDALNAVLAQTFKNYEVIVINDGSTDNTGAVIKQFMKSAPEMKFSFIEQKNLGIGAARNAGMKRANGEFAAFLDADDVWYEDKLERVYSVLKENPEIDLVCHDENLVHNGKVVRRNVYGPYTTYYDLLFKGNCISTSATVVRKDKVIRAGLFSEDLGFNGVEDYELWLRLSKFSRFYYLHEVLGEYRVFGEGVTGDIERHTRNVFNVFEHHIGTLTEEELERYEGDIRKRRANISFLAGWAYLKRNDFLNAGRWFVKSIETDRTYLAAYAGYGITRLKIRNITKLYDKLSGLRRIRGA
ncbi:MAG: glycosyltransferase [Candidatus Dadabacteria bacterium]|nr:MAG: glycosyltransferase [Candidatus Dadabacteria bacterium]